MIIMKFSLLFDVIVYGIDSLIPTSPCPCH